MLTFDEQYTELLHENRILKAALTERQEEEGGMGGLVALFLLLMGFALGFAVGGFFL